MLQSSDPDRLGNKKECWRRVMNGSPWEEEIEEVSWVDWGQVGIRP